jgi:hypothetical protein
MTRFLGVANGVAIDVVANAPRREAGLPESVEECPERRSELAAEWSKYGSAIFYAAAVACGPVRAESVAREVFVDWSRDDRFIEADAPMTRATLVLAAYRRASAAGSGSPGVGLDWRNEQSGHHGADRLPPGANAAVALLAEGDREALVVTLFGRCTYKQAATLLGEGARIVASRVRSALRQLAVGKNDVQSGGIPQ